MNGRQCIRITIDKTGAYRFEAMEGFSGQSCVEKTKTIELVLGGTQVDSGKKDSYYNGDSPENVFVNI